MKRLKTVAFLAVLFLNVNNLTAQNVTLDKKIAEPRLIADKPRLFNRLPEKIALNRPALDQLFSRTSRRISFPLNDNSSFEGDIIEKVQKNPNVLSMNIKLSNYDGALFNVSRIINSDLSITYIGRVINHKNGDMLVMKKEGSTFYFTKEQTALVE